MRRGLIPKQEDYQVTQKAALWPEVGTLTQKEELMLWLLGTIRMPKVAERKPMVRPATQKETAPWRRVIDATLRETRRRQIRPTATQKGL